jgi:hypothetical protein
VQPRLTQLARHYDERYYVSGHGGFQPDSSYFRLLGRYWRKKIFEDTGRDPEAPILDFGAGLGLVTSACPNVICVEHSEFAAASLTKLGRLVFQSLDTLPPPVGGIRSKTSTRPLTPVTRRTLSSRPPAPPAR